MADELQQTPVRFRVEEETPAHTTVRVFIGQEGQGGNAGLLTVRTEELPLLEEMKAAHAMRKALEACEQYIDALAASEPGNEFTKRAVGDERLQQIQAALAQARGEEPAS